MHTQLEKPGIPPLTICVYLSLPITTKIFKQPKERPALLGKFWVSAATHQYETVDRKWCISLLDYSCIRSRNGLISLAPSACINQNVAFKTVMVRILARLTS